MKRTVVVFALCAVGFGACGSGASEGGDVVVIDVDQAMRSAPRGLKVSDFVDSISFIPIYDGNTMYMGDPRLMTVTSDHIFVSDGADRLVGYNLRERTSWQIGTRGRGPGEYLRMDALVADEKSRVVYALVDDPKPGAIHKYDFDGELVDIFPLEEDADNVGLTGDGHLVVLSSNYFGNSKHQFFVLNGQGRMVVDHPNPFSFTMVGPQGPTYQESVKYNHGGELHIKGKGDTLYRFSGRERYPKYVFKNRFSIDGDRDLSRAEYDNAFRLLYLFETGTKILFNGIIDNRWQHFWYDKTTGQAWRLDGDVENDLTDYPENFWQITADTTFGDCYVKIVGNPEREGDPPLEEVSYFLMLLHLK